MDPKAMTPDELQRAEERASDLQHRWPTEEGEKEWDRLNDEIGRRSREADARGLKSWRDVAPERT